MSEDDGRIEYIKQSLDDLHHKIERIYEDSDRRLKVLEISHAHSSGFVKAASIMAGVVGACISSMITYCIYKYTNINGP